MPEGTFMTEKEIFTKTAKAPAEFLDKTVISTQRVAAALPNNPVVRRTKNYWHVLGPGLTTGASDDDPSGIATYSQTGAQYGFQLIWLSAATFPLMAIVQEMCARIGMVTGRGLAATSAHISLGNFSIPVHCYFLQQTHSILAQTLAQWHKEYSSYTQVSTFQPS